MSATGSKFLGHGTERETRAGPAIANDDLGKPQWLGLLLVFAGYFLVQAVSRGLITETLGMDEAEQALLAQKWSWGYGPQPPLYTWLVLLVSKAVGLSSFTMALLKNALLFSIYTLTYFIAHRITRSHIVSIAAAVALQFMPSIAYEAHRELTHSILASLMVLATLLVFLRLTQSAKAGLEPSQADMTSMQPISLSSPASNRKAAWGYYLLLGVLGGLGTLSKYNYSIFYFALILAALSMKSWRSAILNVRAGTAFLITLLILAPNLLWVKSHPELALASMGKFDIDPHHSLHGMLRGLGSWFTTCLDQVGLLLVLFALLCWRGLLSSGLKSKLLGEDTRLLFRVFCCMAGLIFLGIIISGATNCRNRWLQPLAIPAPILVAALCSEQIVGRRVRIILSLAGAVALGVAIAAPIRILLTERLGKVEGLNAPFRDLGRQLQQPLANVPMIFCADTAMAGNLRIWFPEKVVTAIGVSKLYSPTSPCALIWDASWTRSDAFVSDAAHLTGRAPAELIYCQARLKYHHTAVMRIGVLTPR